MHSCSNSDKRDWQGFARQPDRGAPTWSLRKQHRVGRLIATFQQDQEVAKWFIFSVSQAAGPCLGWEPNRRATTENLHLQHRVNSIVSNTFIRSYLNTWYNWIKRRILPTNEEFKPQPCKRKFQFNSYRQKDKLPLPPRTIKYQRATQTYEAVKKIHDLNL